MTELIQSAQTKQVVNALTIDVEDYYHVHALSKVVAYEDWDSFEPMVEKNTYHILDILDSGASNEVGAMDNEPGGPLNVSRATFFILGWVAQRYPGLVKEINSRGHEIACHGYNHKCIFNQTKKEFKEDVIRAKGILEDLIGAEIIGYRAPSYSIIKGTLWALEILFEIGFRYDSSIFPIKHDLYGIPKAPRFPFIIDFSNDDLLSQLENPNYSYEDGNVNKKLDKPIHNRFKYPVSDIFFVEFPITTLSFYGINLPCSGGGYFRLFPLLYTRWGINKINRQSGMPVIFYIHPWELNPDTPKINGTSMLSLFRTYINLKKTSERFNKLLMEFKFGPLASML